MKATANIGRHTWAKQTEDGNDMQPKKMLTKYNMSVMDTYQTTIQR